MFHNKRVGYFEIEVPMINEHPDVVRLVMGQVIVSRADESFARHSIHYLAICDAFEEVTPGEYFPCYDVAYDPATGEVTWTKSEERFQWP